jgi:hypothetical protein
LAVWGCRDKGPASLDGSYGRSLLMQTTGGIRPFADVSPSVNPSRAGADIPPAFFLSGTVQTRIGSAVRVAWPDGTAAYGHGPEGGELPSPALLPGARRLAHGDLLWWSVVRQHRQQHQLGADALDVSAGGSA